jgi:hypothetical protein
MELIDTPSLYKEILIRRYYISITVILVSGDNLRKNQSCPVRRELSRFSVRVLPNETLISQLCQCNICFKGMMFIARGKTGSGSTLGTPV